MRTAGIAREQDRLINRVASSWPLKTDVRMDLMVIIHEDDSEVLSSHKSRTVFGPSPEAHARARDSDELTHTHTPINLLLQDFKLKSSILLSKIVSVVFDRFYNLQNSQTWNIFFGGSRAARAEILLQPPAPISKSGKGLQ